jgi:uncharacterized protein YchJ
MSKKIIDYIISLTNLYGLIHKDKVVEIYNMQNEEQISDIGNVDIAEINKNFVYDHEDYFVHETIMEFDTFDKQLRESKNKPYYIPDKEELLKYRDDFYFERNIQYKKLLNYVKNNFFNGDEEKAEYLCEDIHGTCQFGFDIHEVFDLFNVRNVNFTDEKQVNEVMQLVTELSNNVRLWENNGHTPHEIFEKFEKPNLKSLPDRSFKFGDSNATKKKIGRNDPCPCGSGKKYKKCCLD